MLIFFFIVPLFGVVILGMLWKRATPAGGFWGLLAGTVVMRMNDYKWAQALSFLAFDTYNRVAPRAKVWSAPSTRSTWRW